MQSMLSTQALSFSLLSVFDKVPLLAPNQISMRAYVISEVVGSNVLEGAVVLVLSKQAKLQFDQFNSAKSPVTIYSQSSTVRGGRKKREITKVTAGERGPGREMGAILFVFILRYLQISLCSSEQRKLSRTPP